MKFSKAFKTKLTLLRYALQRRPQYDPAKVSTILCVHTNNKIGDMIVSTPLYALLKKQGYMVHVVAGKVNAQIIEHNPHVDKIIVMNPNSRDRKNVIKALAEEKYDLIIDPVQTNRRRNLTFLMQVGKKYIICFNRPKIKAFEKNFQFAEADVHFIRRYELILDYMGIPYSQLDYDIPIPAEIEVKVDAFLQQNECDKFVVLNPFASDKERDPSPAQLQSIVNHLHSEFPQYKVVLTGLPKQLENIDYLPSSVISNPFSELLGSVELVRRAALVISPDTSIVHAASAFKKPTVAVYRYSVFQGFPEYIAFGPNNPNAKQILSDTTLVRDIDPDIINAAITEKLNELA